MPLKHATETLLSVILAFAIIFAGVLAALLPALPGGVIPWALAIVASIAYPVALYPLFKERRADYAFRMLHFLPAAILLVRLVLGILASRFSALEVVDHLYTWGWSLIPVLASLLGLLWFCLKVVRQRMQRLGALAALFLSFAATAFILPLLTHVPSAGGPLIIGQVSSVSSSSQASFSSRPSNESEEKWLMEQRRMQRRTERLAHVQSSPPSVHGAIVGMLNTSVGSQMSSVSDRDPPPHLPSSGMGTEALFVTLIGVYTAVLHQRAKRRLV